MPLADGDDRGHFFKQLNRLWAAAGNPKLLSVSDAARFRRSTGPQRISSWLNGEHIPSRQNLERLVTVLIARAPSRRRLSGESIFDAAAWQQWRAAAEKAAGRTAAPRLRDNASARLPVRLALKSQRPARFWVPPLRPGTVRRGEKYDELVDRLVSPSRRPVTITSLRGAGGTGKTVLAQDACHDARVWSAFPGGIYWVVLGLPSDSNLERANQELYTQLTGRSAPAITRTDVLVADEFTNTGIACLVVLDDVWDLEQYSSIINTLPENVQVLATTRGVPLGEPEIRVGEMTDSEAMSVLARGAPFDPSLHTLLQQLATALGRWALLLNLAGGYLQQILQPGNVDASKHAVSELLKDVRKDPTVLDQPDSLNRSLDHAIRRSRDACGAASGWFDQLAVFPADAAIPLDVLAVLWNTQPTRVRTVCMSFASRGLLEFQDERGIDRSTIHIHDLIVGWLHARFGRPGDASLQGLHERCATLPATLAELTPGRAKWIHFHLVMAGRYDRILALTNRNTAPHFRRATGSDSAFLAGCRLTAATALNAANEALYASCWLAARWCESHLVGQIRNTPVEVLLVEVRLGNTLGALAIAAELERYDAVTLIRAVIRAHPGDERLVEQALTLIHGRPAYEADAIRAAVADELHQSAPADHHTLSRALAVLAGQGSEIDRIKERVAERYFAQAPPGPIVVEQLRRIASSIRAPYYRGSILGLAAEAAAISDPPTRSLLADQLVNVAYEANPGWGRHRLLAIAARHMDTDAERAAGLIEAAYVELANVETIETVNRPHYICDLAESAARIHLGIDAFERLIEVYDRLGDPYAMALLAKQAHQLDPVWAMRALERALARAYRRRKLKATKEMGEGAAIQALDGRIAPVSLALSPERPRAAGRSMKVPSDLGE